MRIKVFNFHFHENNWQLFEILYNFLEEFVAMIWRMNDLMRLLEQSWPIFWLSLWVCLRENRIFGRVNWKWKKRKIKNGQFSWCWPLKCQQHFYQRNRCTSWDHESGNFARVSFDSEPMYSQSSCHWIRCRCDRATTLRSDWTNVINSFDSLNYIDAYFCSWWAFVDAAANRTTIAFHRRRNSWPYRLIRTIVRRSFERISVCWTDGYSSRRYRWMCRMISIGPWTNDPVCCEITTIRNLLSCVTMANFLAEIAVWSTLISAIYNRMTHALPNSRKHPTAAHFHLVHSCMVS